MNALHQKGYSHRDLNLRNILIKDKKIVKIADFGISKDKDKLKTRLGTELYMVLNK